jgi:hypothetical protein
MNSIIRSIVGVFVTLESEGISNMINALKKAEGDYNKAIQSGALTKPNKELHAQANGCKVTLSKLVDKKGQPTKKFEEELMPFHLRSELLASINHALSESVSAWTDFEGAYEKVVAYANKRKVEGLFNQGDKQQPKPWEKTPEEGALNWAWGPLLEAIQEGDDPEEVKAVVEIRVRGVADSLRDLELVRTGTAVRGLKKLLREAKALRAELRAKKAANALFDDIAILQQDLKRAGRGSGPSVVERVAANAADRAAGAVEERFQSFLDGDMGPLTKPAEA